MRYATWAIVATLACVGMARGAGVADVVAQMPAANVADDARLAGEIINAGEPALREVLGMLTPSTTGGDARARYALAAVCRHATRPGADAHRKAVETAILATLAAAQDAELKALFLQHLQWVGTDTAVPAIAKHLGDDALCEPAVAALVVIATPAAQAALLEALPAAQGDRRIPIAKALGTLRVDSAADPLLKLAGSPDAPVRQAALSALAHIGAPSSRDALANAVAAAATPLDRSRATADYLRYARRAGERGQRDVAQQICRDLMKQRTAPEEASVRAAALSTLVAVAGEGAMLDLSAAAAGADRELRGAALEIFRTVPGPAITAGCVELLKKSPAEVKVDVLALLAGRGDASAAPAVAGLLADKDDAVRAAAIDAYAALARDAAVPALLKVVETAAPADAKLAADALARLPGDAALAQVAAALPKAPAPAKVALLDLLAARAARAQADAVLARVTDEDAAVRLAALKALERTARDTDLPRLTEIALAAKAAEEAAAIKSLVATAARAEDPAARAAPVIAAIAKATGPKRAALVAALPRLGGQAALEALLADAKSADTAVKEAALRALTDWPDLAAVPALLTVAKQDADRKTQILALRGAVQVTKAAKAAPAEKLPHYRDALAAAQRPEERKLVLAALGTLHTVEALDLVEPLLDDAALKPDAAATLVRIILPGDSAPGLRTPRAAATLRKAIPATPDPRAKAEAEKHLAAITR